MKSKTVWESVIYKLKIEFIDGKQRRSGELAGRQVRAAGNPNYFRG
jgi:hypothetical protein